MTVEYQVESQRGDAAVDADVLELLCATSGSWNAVHFEAALGSLEADPDWPLLAKAFDRHGGLVGVTGAVPRRMSSGRGTYWPAAQLGFGAVRDRWRGSDVFPRLMWECLRDLSVSASPPAFAYGFSPRVDDYEALIGGFAVPECEVVLPRHAGRPDPHPAPVAVRRLDPTVPFDLRSMMAVYKQAAASYVGPLERSERDWRDGFLRSREDVSLCLGAWRGAEMVGYLRTKPKRSGQARIAEAFAVPGEPAVWLGLLARLWEMAEAAEVSFSAGESHPLTATLRSAGGELRTTTRMVVCALAHPEIRSLFLAEDRSSRFYLPHIDRL